MPTDLFAHCTLIVHNCLFPAYNTLFIIHGLRILSTIFCILVYEYLFQDIADFSRFSVFYCILFLHMRILFHYLPRIFFAFFIVFPCFSSIIITCVFHFYNFHSYIHPKKFYHFYRNKKKSPEKPDAMSCVRGHFHTASGENFSLFSI